MTAGFQYEILYQLPQQFMVFMKPSGIDTYSFAEKIRMNFSSAAQQTFCNRRYQLHPVHRLDKVTSGCLVLGQTPSARRKLGKAFENRSIHKTYIALVQGTPAKSAGTIDRPIMESDDAFTATTGYRRMLACTKTNTAKAHEAVTEYEIIASNGSFSLLRLHPVTGRTHQLRVHCSAVLNTPIVNDPLYNNETRQNYMPGIPQPLTMLHSHQIVIPWTHVMPGEKEIKEKIEVTAPMPQHMTMAVVETGLYKTESEAHFYVSGGNYGNKNFPATPMYKPSAHEGLLTADNS